MRVDRFVSYGVVLFGLAGSPRVAEAVRPHPILFVTQVPVVADPSQSSVFGNHRGDAGAAGRGGDLYILYPDGTVKNLTLTAGYGATCAGPASVPCFQGTNAIAVREPSVHWSGTKALFSMVIGAPTAQHVPVASFWQIYEVTGLNLATQAITKVPNQPSTYNNVSPFYGTDERVLFTSDRPRDGQPQLYPQLDEYKSIPTVTGLWSLDPVTGDLHLLNHTPSGLFSPSIDSFGRIVFSRWDHLQRDALADADVLNPGNPPNHTFDYADETANAARTTPTVEVFPEPQGARTDLVPVGGRVVGMEFNQFFPWVMNEDGTSEEIIDHMGRHDLRFAIGTAFNTTTDPDLKPLKYNDAPLRTNQNFISNFLEIRESPTTPGLYFGVDANENGTHGGGQVVTLNAPPNPRPDLNALTYWTDPSGSFFFQGAGPDPNATHTGHYRNPLPLSDGITVIVAHTSEMRADANIGTAANPTSRYAYRLKNLDLGSAALPGSLAGATKATGGTPPLTPGFTKSVWWWDPDNSVTYTNVPLWELDPVEVVFRSKPTAVIPPLGAPELAAFTAAGLDASTAPAALRKWMAANDLALIVSRNLTTRDHDDRQQPFNLRVALHGGGFGATTTASGYVAGTNTLYNITHLEIFQADQLRGSGGTVNPVPGRRVLARPMHAAAALLNVPDTNVAAPSGTVEVGTDGSTAAFVPARRALSWQLTDDAFTPVIHERYWLTFQPGEIRVCTSCHGLSHTDQAGAGAPTNTPQALVDLLQHWQAIVPPPPVAPGFYTLKPCRLLDTRLADGSGGGPALVASGSRLVLLANRCGVPPTAKAVSINVTVAPAVATGGLRLYAGTLGAAPLVSTISFTGGTTRANNGVIGLASDGTGSVRVQNLSAGGAQVIVDVNGYFQ